MITVNGFHGTVENFEVEDIKKPAFFGKRIETARFFAQNRGRILNARIKAEKVLEFDVAGASWGAQFWTGIEAVDDAIEEYIFKNECIDKNGDIIEDEQEYWEENGPTFDYVVSWAEEQGYDLIIAHAVYDDDAGTVDTNYVALNNAIVKANN